MIELIYSKKHPGATFLKEKDGEFILKIYPAHKDKTQVILQALIEHERAKIHLQGETP